MDHLGAYENIDHVLNVLSEMHEQIAQVLHKLAIQAYAERQKMVLEYLADQQSKRAVNLLAYHQHADKTLLNQWFQIPFPEDPNDLLMTLQSTDRRRDLINHLIVELDRFTDRLLAHLRDRAETDNVKALFQDLLDIEMRERLLRSRAISSFTQI